MHSVRHWISFFVGLLIFALGLLPLIGRAPSFLNNIPGAIAVYIVAFGGLYVIVDSFFEFTFHSGIGISTLLVGLVIFGIGLVDILHNMGTLSFHVLSPKLSVVYYVLFMLEGLFLMFACFVMD